MKNTARWIPIVITATFAFVLLGVFIYRQVNPPTVSLSNIRKTDAQISAEASSPIQNGKININTASADDLTLLPGIGDTLAQRIIDYRNENGSFIQLEDLMNVSGIGKVRFDAISDYITLGQ